MTTIRGTLLLMSLALPMVGCQTPADPDREADGYTRAVEEPVAETPPEGQRYEVVTERSELRIVIRPEGRMGHAHVMGGEAITGEVVLPAEHHDAWLDLAVQVDALQVDEPAWRTDEGFDPDMSERAIEGTRENMLSGEVLNAEAHPVIRIRAGEATGPAWQPDVRARITLAGETRERTVPVSVHRDDDELEVTGRFRILQTEFGIEPFSALGGALRVDDEVLIRFRIHAEPAPD